MIRDKLGLNWARFKLRERGESPPIYFARTIRAMKKLLICLPEKELEAEKAVQAIIKAARTGEVGDGRVFVTEVEETYKIRTGEKGPDTLYIH